MDREEMKRIAESVNEEKMCYELFQCDQTCLGFGLCPYTSEDEEVESQPVIINIGKINIHF